MLPPNARVGDRIQVEVRVTDSTQAEPFISRFKIAVAPAATDREPSPPGPQKPRGGNMLAMPEIIPVTRDGREVDGKKSVPWGTDFNKLTALEIRPAGDEGKYDIFVNMDNIHLLDELHRERRSSEHPLIAYYFKYGLTLVALGMLQEHRRREANAESNDGLPANSNDDNEEAKPRDYLADINAACMGIASVIIPVIQQLSQGPGRVGAGADQPTENAHGGREQEAESGDEHQDRPQRPLHATSTRWKTKETSRSRSRA